VYCAGLNYRDHAEEVRMPVPANPVFFTKSHGALCGGYDAVVYPRQVALLDYEIELAVIIGRAICNNTPLTEENLQEYILGIAIMNDVSARDIQLSRGQWFLGKSFRTFAPLGPVLQVFDRDVAGKLYDLTLSLSVSDSMGRRYENKKQHGTTGNMIFPISRLLNELRACVDLLPGDVVATGTPAGVAMSSPGRLETRVADILGIPQGRRIARFLARERKTNHRYLQPGDVVESRVYSSDCAVDLGIQRNEIIGDE
jgi:2-keto-4-pentenoate hydratase/2-oxohepta-3-ene-1,7-dioic acid hydratase in catechol pathway